MNALISVYDKSSVADFAKQLVRLGWTIYASEGTAKAIAKAGISVKDISQLVGGGAILDHRVVTLSREIHAGLLADESQAAELKKLGIPRLDLAYVDMYPLHKVIAKKNAKEADVIELTDIGGPTILRAAAKGRRIILCRKDQQNQVINWLKAGQPNKQIYLRQLAAEAEFEVAKYVWRSAQYLAKGEAFGFLGKKVAQTKYGENPWQQNSGLYINESDDPLAVGSFEQLGGTQLSYNNYADIDRLLQTTTHIATGFAKNFGLVNFIAVGAKHGNVCGASVAPSADKAIKNMLEGDLRAIFGGVVMLNFAVGKIEAQLLLEHAMPLGQKRLLDVVAAPDFSKDATQLLQRKGGKLRLIKIAALANLNERSLDQTERFRYVRGGVLVQQNYTFILDFADKSLETIGKASAAQSQDMLLAWAIGSTSNSNTITLVKGGLLLGNGVGQQDRVSAAQLAIKRAGDAGHNLSNAVAYSDSFFPFPDGPLELAKAGVGAILATRGSVNDAKVAAALKKAGVIFYTLPDSEARGFYAH